METEGSIDATQGEDPRLDTVLQGRYKILERLAAGGMGVVYRGERLRLERPVAIKFLHATFAVNPASLKRFEREARTMSRLSHPNCVSVIDIGIDEGSPYIVMDYIAGRNLKDILEAEGRLAPKRAIDITLQILAALTHAHSQDMVHRDIKPANIMLSEVKGTADHVYVLDFGLAKFSNDALAEDITASCTLLGTPSYMSPEQARGEALEPSSDIYSTGAVLFELVTGSKLYTDENPLKTLQMHQFSSIPTLGERVSDARFSPELEAVIKQALAKGAANRFSTADEFAAALAAVPEAETGRKATEDRAESEAEKTVATSPVALGKAKAKADKKIAFAKTQPLVTLDLVPSESLPRGLDSNLSLGVEIAAREPARDPSKDVSPAPADEPLFPISGASRTATTDPVVAVAPEKPTDETPAPSAETVVLHKSGERESADAASEQVLESAPEQVLEPAPEQPRSGEMRPSDTGRSEPGGQSGAAVPSPTVAERRPPRPRGRGRLLAVAAFVLIPAAAVGAFLVMSSGGEPGAGDSTGKASDGGAVGVSPSLSRPRTAADAGASAAARKNAPDAGGAAAKNTTNRSAASPVKPTVVTKIKDVQNLIAGGHREEAIRGIQKLLGSTHKKNGYLYYLLGNLYFEKRWWGDGLDAYRQALTYKPAYRGYKKINQNAIEALVSDKTRVKSNTLFLRYIRRDGLPHLRRAVKNHKSPRVRKRAAWLVKKIGSRRR